MRDPNSIGEFPAFPCRRDELYGGLRKREYIATQILSGLVTRETIMDKNSLVEMAVIYADLLLTKLEEE